ncbi:PAS domain-containing protein [Aliiroseovarius sp. F20344]|uniref:PAS domain-containing protein n=1 Tax=Aliiroseovarius sp. F20344 TaxID=2926414 RepID=UPI001FF6F801|nr:PAS domain-containing protein [Aliiroseovarius sp. F20344]MCK0143673.1 PAS domain-containing protein [Aliiroseovarius sp. F20344]
MKIEYLQNGNVVSLSSARQVQKFNSIALVEAYWHGLRNGRLCPTRQEVDPRGMAGALHEAFMLEKIAPGLARIRLAGQHMNDVLGMEVRGMPISAFFTTEARKELHRALESLFDMPAQITLSLVTEGRAFRKGQEAQMILLPLRDETGLITRVLGALQVEGDLDRTPQRFNIRSAEVTAIVADDDAAPAFDQIEKDYRAGSKSLRSDQKDVDQRLGTSPRGMSGHVFREPKRFEGETLHEFAEARRHFDLGEPQEIVTGQRKAKVHHLRLIKTD